jgi:hypothetical protein
MISISDTDDLRSVNADKVLTMGQIRIWLHYTKPRRCINIYEDCPESTYPQPFTAYLRAIMEFNSSDIQEYPKSKPIVLPFGKAGGAHPRRYQWLAVDHYGFSLDALRLYAACFLQRWGKYRLIYPFVYPLSQKATIGQRNITSN